VVIKFDPKRSAKTIRPQVKLIDTSGNEVKIPGTDHSVTIGFPVGALIQVRDIDEAIAIANHIAPEHLELSLDQPEIWSKKVKHAGAIFMGRMTCEALGDYCAGPNHVLPTSRTARFSSPLGVYDFQKRTSLLHVSAAGAVTLGKIAATLANGEGLQAQSAQYRIA